MQPENGTPGTPLRTASRGRERGNAVDALTQCMLIDLLEGGDQRRMPAAWLTVVLLSNSYTGRVISVFLFRGCTALCLLYIQNM